LAHLGQVTRAQEAEVMFQVKRELSQLREQNKELRRSLEASEEQIAELKSSNQVTTNDPGSYQPIGRWPGLKSSDRVTNWVEILQLSDEPG